MGLKESGFTFQDWDNWSQKDSARYHAVNAKKKWNTFAGSGTPITGGTIVQMAMESGWTPAGTGHELNWDDEIENDGLTIIDKDWVEGREVLEPEAGIPPNS